MSFFFLFFCLRGCLHDSHMHAVVCEHQSASGLPPTVTVRVRENHNSKCDKNRQVSDCWPICKSPAGQRFFFFFVDLELFWFNCLF